MWRNLQRFRVLVLKPKSLSRNPGQLAGRIAHLLAPVSVCIFQFPSSRSAERFERAGDRFEPRSIPLPLTPAAMGKPCEIPSEHRANRTIRENNADLGVVGKGGDAPPQNRVPRCALCGSAPYCPSFEFTTDAKIAQNSSLSDAPPCGSAASNNHSRAIDSSASLFCPFAGPFAILMQSRAFSRHLDDLVMTNSISPRWMSVFIFISHLYV